MRFLVILLLIVAFTTDLSLAWPRKKLKCPRICKLNYDPVCSIKGEGIEERICTFINMCALRMQMCKTKQRWMMMSKEPCQWPSNDCYEVIDFVRNNTELFTHRGIIG